MTCRFAVWLLTAQNVYTGLRHNSATLAGVQATSVRQRRTVSLLLNPADALNVIQKAFCLYHQTIWLASSSSHHHLSGCSANGFSTSKQNLELLEAGAKSKGMDDAVDFLYKVRRLSAVDTYLSSFVEGIRNYTKPDGKLHVSLLQHRTSTGRFSGANPNMQNMPRGGTFPVKKVFVSRFDGGKVMEADFAQLEFRAAAYLSQDEVAIEEVSTGFDVHAYTAKVITDAGQPTSRQDAKAHTFAPLYGATGYGRTKAEAAYYEHFNSKYKGVAAWHSRLAKEAIETQKITTPSGREFAFPMWYVRLVGVYHTLHRSRIILCSRLLQQILFLLHYYTSSTC